MRFCSQIREYFAVVAWQAAEGPPNFGEKRQFMVASPLAVREASHQTVRFRTKRAACPLLLAAPQGPA